MAETLTNEEISSSFIGASVSGSNKAKYVSDCVEFMPRIIMNLVKMEEKGGEDRWILELSFHVIHMVFCQDIDVPEEFLKGLFRMYNVYSETVSETNLKIAYISLGKHGLHFS